MHGSDLFIPHSSFRLFIQVVHGEDREEEQEKEQRKKHQVNCITIR